MIRVARALAWAEFVERTRDRWVLVISIAFTALASGVSLYARSLETQAAYLAGPSLVTLASLFIPLVALVLGHDAIAGERDRNTLGLILALPVSKLEVVLAKFVGRLAALASAVALGLGAAIVMAPSSERQVLVELLGPTLWLGAAFLAVGLCVSAMVTRQVTATSLIVAGWFGLVLLYDLGLLALLIATDGAFSQEWIVRFVELNPVGLYRLQMMQAFAGPEFFDELGVTFSRSAGWLAVHWAAVIVVPLSASALLLSLRKVER